MTQRKSYRDLLAEGRKFTNEPVIANGQKWKRSDDLHKRFLFARWEMQADIVQQLEELRDEHEPKSQEAEFDDLFVFAVTELPNARERERQYWLDYAERAEQ